MPWIQRGWIEYVSALLTSLTGYWTMDETSGNALDILGVTTLTDHNSVGTAAGKVGTARQFNVANTRYFDAADNAAMSVGDLDFTFAVWVYIDSKGANRNILSKGTTFAANTTEYFLEFTNSSDRFRFIIGDTTNTLSSIAVANNLGSPSLATWYFIVAWHDSVGNTVNIQVNDGTVNSVGTSGRFPPDTTGSFTVGRLNGVQHWDGRIDELGFWKRALTAAERTSLYNAGSGRSYPFSGT